MRRNEPYGHIETQKNQTNLSINKVMSFKLGFKWINATSAFIHRYKYIINAKYLKMDLMVATLHLAINQMHRHVTSRHTLSFTCFSC